MEINIGIVVINLGGLRDGYYINADIAVIVFNDRQSYLHVPTWHRDIIRVRGDIPVICVQITGKIERDLSDSSIIRKFTHYVVVDFADATGTGLKELRKIIKDLGSDKVILANKSKIYSQILQYLDDGNCTTPETMTVKHQGKTYNISCDYSFSYDWSNGLNIRRVENIKSTDEIVSLSLEQVKTFRKVIEYSYDTDDEDDTDDNTKDDTEDDDEDNTKDDTEDDEEDDTDTELSLNFSCTADISKVYYQGIETIQININEFRNAINEQLKKVNLELDDIDTEYTDETYTLYVHSPTLGKFECIDESENFRALMISTKKSYDLTRVTSFTCTFSVSDINFTVSYDGNYTCN